MNQTFAGSFRIFRAFGVDVYLHWTWFLMGLILVQVVGQWFESPAWNLALFLAIFGIVLLHEFGHALACKSVGGRAEQIMLWPLGGVAFVRPPNRPGAHLWSIAAGPLVNVLLVPVTLAAYVAFVPENPEARTDLAEFVRWVTQINMVILIFNLLPIYPLDGGQILQALLWFAIGRARSLQIAAGAGLVFAVAGGLLALSIGHVWLVVLALFVGWQAWIGWQQARYMVELQRTGGY